MSLKIPKGSSESVNRRRTDNTMAKRKRTKGQTTICKKKNDSTFKNNITPLRQLTGNKECWIKSE